MTDKETLIERRIQERDGNNPSLAEQMIIAAGGSISDLKPEQAEDKESPKKAGGLQVCWNCNGAGVVDGLFKKQECFACDGTGYDNSDPLAIIKKQKEYLAWAKKEIVGLRRENKRLDPRTNEEKHADAVTEFYGDSKRNKHD